MPIFQYSNNASSLLAAAITDTDTTIQVGAGEGAEFPSPNATLGLVFNITLENDAGAMEICQCTARTGDLLTVVRGQEGTSAIAWDPGAGAVRVELRLTQAVMESLISRYIAYVSAGDGIRFDDVSGVTAATLFSREDPARADKVLLEILGSTAAVSLKSLIETKVNDVTWPLATASRTEGYVPELDSTANELVWMPRGGLVLNESATPMTRRVTLQYAGNVAVTDDGTKTVVTVGSGAIVGEVRSFAQTSMPTAEWLVCDGTSYTVAAYPALHAAIGDTYGGDGGTNFNVPNLSGRSVLGAGQGNTAEGGGLGTTRTVGDSVGAEEHTIVGNELPALSFNQPLTSKVGSQGAAPDFKNNGQSTTVTVNKGSPGNAHNNMHPSLVLLYGIYAGA